MEKNECVRELKKLYGQEFSRMRLNLILFNIRRNKAKYSHVIENGEIKYELLVKTVRLAKKYNEGILNELSKMDYKETLKFARKHYKKLGYKSEYSMIQGLYSIIPNPTYYKISKQVLEKKKRLYELIRKERK